MFDGRKVEASIADGSEKFKKSKEKKAVDSDDEDGGDENKRLHEFGKWLETEKGKGVVEKAIVSQKDAHGSEH